METTINKMTADETLFFDRLIASLETQVYFFGSIQRPDYFPKHSDIDVDIFSFHEKSIVYKLSSFLNVDNSKFKRFVTRPNDSMVVMNGYKYMYKDPEGRFSVEFSVYNEKFKEAVLKDHLRKFVLPFYILYPLILLKFIYHKLNLMPTETFRSCKKVLMGVTDDSYHSFVMLQ